MFCIRLKVSETDVMTCRFTDRFNACRLRDLQAIWSHIILFGCVHELMHTYLVKSLEFPTEALELTTHLFFALLKNQREIIFQDDTLSLHPHHAYYCIQERSKLAKLPSELAAH